MSDLVEAYLEQVGMGTLPCSLLGHFCALQQRPRPRIFDELAACQGSNAERDLHTWADHQDFMQALPPLYQFMARA